jgi:CheY-like chemotaxis protein
MFPLPVSTLSLPGRIRPRTALVASADSSFRQRLSGILNGLRWQVRQAEGGAQAWAEAETAPPEAVIVDSWLPDLELSEFLKDFRTQFPDVDLVTASGTEAQESPRGPHRQELLYALHRSQDNDTAIWNTAPVLDGPFTPPFRGNESSLPARSGSGATADAAALPPVPAPLPSALSAIVPAAGKSTHRRETSGFRS